MFFGHASGEGLAGSQKLSRSMLSAMQVAASRKVSMKDWKVCLFVLATLSSASLSSLTSLQCTRTKDNATSAPQRADDFFHFASVRYLIQSSHQRLEVLRQFRLRPEFSINPSHRCLQASKISNRAVHARFQPQHIHRNIILDWTIYGIETRLDPPSFPSKSWQSSAQLNK